MLIEAHLSTNLTCRAIFSENPCFPIYIGMSEKYQVKCIYEVYLHYPIKICGHLTYLSFILGVPDTLISNIYAIWQ